MYFCGQESLRRNRVDIIVKKRIQNTVELFSFSVRSNPASWTLQSPCFLWGFFACEASLSSTISWSLLKLMSIESMMPSNHLIFCSPFSSCPQFFPAPGSFPVSEPFASSDESIGASPSVFPMTTRVGFQNPVLGSNLKMTKWSQFISKANHSTWQLSKSMP